MNLSTPSYRHHKPSGQAVVTIGGRDFYLGKHGTKESQAEYDRLIAEWLTNGRRLASGTVASDLTLNELVLAFLRHAEKYYRKPDGQPTSEYGNFKDSLKQLLRLYGCSIAGEFGPMALKTVRQQMIADGHCRTQINKRVSRIVLVFKWAAENEMLPVAVYQGLRTVPGLRKGRSEARESDPVKPVPDNYVDAIEPFVSRQVWTMVQLQRLTGMRPGEVTVMRTCDLDTTGRVWLYRPDSHKTAHFGHARTIYIGPRAQGVLRPWLRTDMRAFLFSPIEAEDARNAEKRRNRRSPMTPSQRARKRKSRPRRTPRKRYDVASYRRAIQRGCSRATNANVVGFIEKHRLTVAPDPFPTTLIVPSWHPHQLRHNAGTWLRKEFGLEVARVVLGHKSPAITEIYAELDLAKAIDVMVEVG